MSLFTKCILKIKYPSDGIRISVMNRHTLNDGKTLDVRINDNKYDEHLILLAPSSKLLGEYYKRNMPWKDYEKRYLEQIRKPELIITVQELAKRALGSDITLLCIEDDATFCHRRLLAEECKIYEPSLKIAHI